jgi:hypothetical protein
MKRNIYSNERVEETFTVESTKLIFSPTFKPIDFKSLTIKINEKEIICSKKRKKQGKKDLINLKTSDIVGYIDEDFNIHIYNDKISVSMTYVWDSQ